MSEDRRQIFRITGNGSAMIYTVDPGSVRLDISPDSPCEDRDEGVGSYELHGGQQLGSFVIAAEGPEVKDIIALEEWGDYGFWTFDRSRAQFAQIAWRQGFRAGASAMQDMVAREGRKIIEDLKEKACSS